MHVAYERTHFAFSQAVSRKVGKLCWLLGIHIANYHHENPRWWLLTEGRENLYWCIDRY